MRKVNEKNILQLEQYIKQFVINHNGISPTLSRIVENTGISKTTAYRYLLELNRKGVITYKGKNTLQINESIQIRTYTQVPLVGFVACGYPGQQEEHIDSFETLPTSWVDGESFLIEAVGDSMIDAGIDSGDLLLVKRTSSANSGQIVVALTENGNTVKRLFWENAKPKLHAENDSYSPEAANIFPSHLIIQGVVKKVIKNIF